MLFQQMKSRNSIKIEAEGVQSPTGRLREESHNSSLIDTSSIDVGNYDHYNTRIPYKKQTTESMIDSCFISLSFLPSTAFLNKIATIANATGSIYTTVALLAIIDRIFLLMISLNLLHILQISLGSVVQPYLISFGTSTHIFMVDSNQSQL